jgi:hypothetical protein
MYKNRIQMLEESHRVLDKQITEGNYSDEQISEMKKRKLILKDEIARLTKLQWIEDNERVDFDDDR